MSRHLQFHISKNNKAKALEFLNSKTSHPLYEIEEKTFSIIGGFFEEIPEDEKKLFISINELPSEVDWQKQWEEFSPHIKNNQLELDLLPYGGNKTLILKPGAGFGDLSHATTSLCIKHMSKRCKDRDVIDFGCGSGILSVAAYAFGANKVISLEIDPSSIIHAKDNLILNGYPNHFVLSAMPNMHLENPLCIINMTFGEQKIALSETSFFPDGTHFLSSGILNEQKNAYIEWAKTKNLDLKLIDKEGKWLIFEGKLLAH